MFKPTHFIGLGGAGCNALEYIHRQGITAKYTCISYPERPHRPVDIRVNLLIRVLGDQTLSSAFERANQQFYWLTQGLNVNSIGDFRAWPGFRKEGQTLYLSISKNFEEIDLQ